MVMCDRRRDLRFIASEVGISFGAVQSILTDTRVENAEQTMEAPWLMKFKEGLFSREGDSLNILG